MNTVKLFIKLRRPEHTMRQRIPVEQVPIIATRQEAVVSLVGTHTPQLLHMTVHQTVQVVHFEIRLVHTVLCRPD